MTRFEEVRAEKLKHSDVETKLPKRNDPGSAGYDFIAKEDFVIPGTKVEDNKLIIGKHLFWTDVKAQLEADEVLLIDIRSGMGSTNDLMISNTIGVIDGSYYENKKNDGNIGISIRNLGNDDYTVHKGDKIAQGVIVKYNHVDEEVFKDDDTRDGGFGSTGK